MLLQTNSYIVPKEKRAEHARLLARFRQTLARLGCDHFESYEQVGANWSGGETPGRFVQIMRFRDRKHQQQVQQSERTDAQAQALIKEFCELINFPYQQQQGLFAVGFYNSVMAVAPTRAPGSISPDDAAPTPPTEASASFVPPPPPPVIDAEPVTPTKRNGEMPSITDLDPMPGVSSEDEDLSAEDISPLLPDDDEEKRPADPSIHQS